MGKELRMTNGTVEDAADPVCHACQTPCSGDFRSMDGEYYHPECRPEAMRG